MRNPRPAATNPLQGTRLYEWGLLSRESLAALIVSPERAAEIMRLYPEEGMRGRPGLFAPSDKKLRASDGGKVDADSEQPDNEVALADEEELVDAAD